MISPFRIRWLALHIRKRAKTIRLAGRAVNGAGLWPGRSQLVRSLDWDAFPSLPGLYWVQGPSRRLYVGETLNLRLRFQMQFDAPRFDFWDTDRQSLKIRYRDLPESDDMFLKGNQSWWIAHWKPVGNYSGFAAS
jgi:hypothetical protein